MERMKTGERWSWPGLGKEGRELRGMGGGVSTRGEEVRTIASHGLLPFPPLCSAVLEPDLKHRLGKHLSLT